MTQLSKNLEAVLNQLAPVFKQTGFTAAKAPDEDSSKGVSLYYRSERGCIRIDYMENKISLFGTNVAFDSAQDGDYKRLSLSLLDEDSQPGDIRYIASDFAESIEAMFAKKSKAVSKGKNNVQTVSKAAVKSGIAYDPITLANRLTLIFPELRPAYKQNIETYGEFLPEDFFSQHGTPIIIDAIRQNDPVIMKKLFALLNEIYDDGTNDVQSLICVSILGQLKNDKILLSNCVDYMSNMMAPPVIEVNRFLATHAGKRAQEKLNDPPAYKPKKEKRNGLMATLLGGGSNMPGINS